MLRVISSRHSVLVIAFIACVTAVTIFILPATAAPRAQTSLPNFRLDANTMISITVAITDGQVIVVPVDLAFLAQNLGGATDVSLIAGVEQQPGIFIGVVPAGAVPATIQLTDATGAVATATPAPTSGAASPTSGEGTHVANANSNLRAGPGTNFERIGRVPEGDAITIVGQNEDGSWLQLDNGSWIAAFLADPLETATDETDSDEPESEDADSEDADSEDADNEAENIEAESETQSASDNIPALPTAGPTVISDQAALAIYLVEIATIGAQANDTIAALSDLFQTPQPLNSQWRSDVSALLSVLSTALDQYLALTPVSGYEDLHAEVTTTALTCEQAVDYLVTGLEEPSAIDPTVATQSVQTCANQAADLSAYLETVQ